MKKKPNVPAPSQLPGRSAPARHGISWQGLWVWASHRIGWLWPLKLHRLWRLCLVLDGMAICDQHSQSYSSGWFPPNVQKTEVESSVTADIILQHFCCCQEQYFFESSLVSLHPTCPRCVVQITKCCNLRCTPTSIYSFTHTQAIPNWTDVLYSLGLAMRQFLPLRISRQADSPCSCGHFEMRLTSVGLFVQELWASKK